MVAAGWLLDLLDAKDSAERNAVQERENALAGTLAQLRHRQEKTVDPLQYFVSIGAEDLLNYEPIFAWEKERPTQKQLELLARRGIHIGAVDTKGKASLLINRLLRRQDEGLSTPKQIKCLEGFGFRHVGGWTFRQARSMLNMLAGSNWQLPRGFDPAAYSPKESRPEGGNAP